MRLCLCGGGECGAVPSAQVVAALTTHDSWLFSTQLNNIVSDQSGGPAQGPEDQNRRDAACLQSPFSCSFTQTAADVQKGFTLRGNAADLGLKKHVWLRHVLKFEIYGFKKVQA